MTQEQARETVRVLPKGMHIEVYAKYVRSVVKLGVGFVPEGIARRKVTRGPLVPGPWAFTFPTAVVIAQIPSPPAPFVTAEVGDLFEVDGHVYRLTDDRPHSQYPDLTPMEVEGEES